MAFLLSASGWTKPSPTRTTTKSIFQCCQGSDDKRFSLPGNSAAAVAVTCDSCKATCHRHEREPSGSLTERVDGLGYSVPRFLVRGLSQVDSVEGFCKDTARPQVCDTFLHCLKGQEGHAWPRTRLHTHPLIVRRCTSRSWCGSACCL